MDSHGLKKICAAMLLGASLCPAAAYGRTESAWPIIGSTPMFYDGNFSLATAAAKDKPAADVGAIIVPHHLLAAVYTARLFKLASGRRVDTVFIVGPNHDNVGPGVMATCQAEWRTPQGSVMADGGLVARLTSDFRLRDAAFAFTDEHSVGAVVPYVARYFPKARIVPVILNSYAGTGEAKKLAAWLVANGGSRSLTVFSIDFSHYLSEERADRADVVTRRLMTARDLGAISRLTNDNVDSPATLMTALEYARLSGWRMEIVANGNSNRVRPEKTAVTTSYFAVAFRRR